MASTSTSICARSTRRPLLIGAGFGGLCASLLILAGLGLRANPPAENPDEIIKEMERKRGTPAPSTSPSSTTPSSTTPSSTAPASSPAATQPSPISSIDPSSPAGTRLLREGTFITNRRGRLTRGASGDLLFTFDADARGKGEAPMSLLPCMNLASMEKVVDRGGDGITFTLSGQVFVYKGRNYVLPTLYQVNRRSGDVNTAQ